MKGLDATLSETCAAWMDSFSRFCSHFTACYTERSRRDAATPSFEIIQDQPTWARAPSPAHAFRSRTRTSSSLEKRRVKQSFAASLRNLTTRTLRSRKASPRRNIRISSPTNFRHVYSHSHQFSADAFEYAAPATRRPPPFQPLQVGVPKEHSPIFPDFEPEVATPPPVARLRDEDGFYLRRSPSTLSFHIPRRPAAGSPRGSPRLTRTKTESPPPPDVPPKSRARAYTAPEAVDHLKERIAEAMLEKERLQEMIDDVVERQSIYLGSRPSTSHSMVTQLQSSPEPLPAIPALPPSAPSFAERLNPELRRSPQTPTAPTTTHTAPTEPNVSFPELVPRPLQVIPFQGPPTPPRSRGEDPPIQPPLPLVLRPPLRKKKSFSRVSTWLFPAHQRGVSIDSVTNVPRPVRGAEGFYQCVSPPVTTASRRSGETVSTLGTWATEEGTVPTTLSAGSPGRGGLERISTFGERRNVGVAV